MDQKYLDLLLEITNLVKNYKHKLETKDVLICFESLLAGAVATAEVQFNGKVLEESIENVRVLYKLMGENMQAYKILKNMGFAKE